MKPKVILFFYLLVLGCIAGSFKAKENAGISIVFKDHFADTTTPLIIKAKDHKALSVTSSAGVIALSSGFDNNFYYTSKADRTGYLYIETRVNKRTNSGYNKIPLNLSIVIDRSGSMQTEKKMEHAKSAAKSIIDRLTAKDYISLVIYDAEVNIIHYATPALDKAMLKRKIDSVYYRGSTNLWGGTEAGFMEVKKNYNSRFINRVLLISDGQANAGLINSNIITGKVQQYKDAEGITLSSFGVGLDYNEVLMTDMAEAGSGNYYFINAPDKMTVLFDNELNGLLNVAAQSAALSIVLPAGIKIKKVFGYKHEQTGAVATIKFRDLFSDETKGVLIEFIVADGIAVPLKFRTSLSYQDIVEGEPKKLTNENILSPNNKAENYLTHFNKKVVEQMILYIASDRLDDAMLEADKSNFGKARTLVNTNKIFIDSNRVYVKSSLELQRMDSSNLSLYRSPERR